MCCPAVVPVAPASHPPMSQSSPVFRNLGLLTPPLAVIRASKPVVKGEVIGLGLLPGLALSLDVGGDPLLGFAFPFACIAFGANKAYIGEVMSSSFLPLVS